jgi:hypothetical protein
MISKFSKNGDAINNCQLIVLWYFSGSHAPALIVIHKSKWAECRVGRAPAKPTIRSDYWWVSLALYPPYILSCLNQDFLVPTRQRGNPYRDAPASHLCERDAGASKRHSHAGAWERENFWFPRAGVGTQSGRARVRF